LICWARLFDLELKRLDAMSRTQLVEAVQERLDCLPVDLRERAEEKETDHLRLLLFAARLIHALRHLAPVQKKASPPSSGCST
jgi:hypothetical protein